MTEMITWLRAAMREIEVDARVYLDSGADNGPGMEWAQLALAEVDGKRRRLERHRPDGHPFHGVICAWCSVPQAGAYQSWPCPDVRDDAFVYADRPGYRSEWAP